ncbi:hypothetical protein LPJ61_005687, partial [Coemansia biformis]
MVAQHASYGGGIEAPPSGSQSMQAEGAPSYLTHQLSGSGWSVAKPAVASLNLPMPAPAKSPTGFKGRSCFAPISMQGGMDEPIQSFIRLRTTADIAAAMDAAAAGDKDALRAIQATTMQSDMDNVPTEPADPRVEFSSHRPLSYSTPLPLMPDAALPRISPASGPSRISPRASILMPSTPASPTQDTSSASTGGFGAAPAPTPEPAVQQSPPLPLPPTAPLAFASAAPAQLQPKLSRN